MYCKKFPFFEEENYEDLNNQYTNEYLMNNFVPSNMFAYDQLIFSFGKLKKKLKNGSEPSEYVILKIFKNKIIDEYKPFNKMINFFEMVYFDNKLYFIICGMDFNLSNTNSKMMLTTSIKFFSAEKFLDKNHKVQDANICVEPYLLKTINLVKYKNDPTKFTLLKDLPINEEFETLNQMISFGVSDDLRHVALSYDKTSIVLIKSANNLAYSNDKQIKISCLQEIDSEFYITNLKFTDFKKDATLLYVSTTKQIFYYSLNEKNEILYIINEDLGAYSGCIFTNSDKLLIATSFENQILEYQSLEMGPSLFFEGKKQMVMYFRGYIIFVVIDDKTNIFAIYDSKSSFFAYYNASFSKISCICADNDFVYAFIENSGSKKILKLKEKDNKTKFSIILKRSFYDTALEYAKKLNYDKEKISYIHKKHGDHVYIKGDYQKAIEQYIYTINYLDPSYVIQKFLDGSKLDYLILYLEALHSENNFLFRCTKEMKDYTALLLNCYIKQKQISKLKTFVEGKELSTQFFNVETAIDVCKESNQIDLALNIAEKSKMFDSYINLLIDYKENYSLALEHIKKEGDINKSLDSLNKYGQKLLNKFPEQTQRFIKEVVSSIISMKSNTNLKYEVLIKIYINQEKLLEDLLDYIMLKDEDNCSSTIIHR